MHAWITFDGITGSSTNKLHKGETAVLAWNWGVTNEQPTGSGAGSGAGKARPHDFTFLHVYDVASTSLAKAAASSKHFKEVLLSVTKDGAGLKDFFKVTMKDVLVSSLEVSADEEDLLAEVSLTPGFIGIEYSEQAPSGAAQSSVTLRWDVLANKVS
ncbi:MAG: type VI secretion system tube protein Hcp [Nostocoides sp.]